MRLVSQNPSADKSGYFENKEEMLECKAKWEKIVAEDTSNYYGQVVFDIDEIKTGGGYFD